tara:strand:- start:2203 stop:2790 length:588 start_codon:yes stop_codon:yes gene_type:complete
MKSYIFALFALLPLILTAPAQAEPMTYKFDTVHSQVIFFVMHRGFSKSEGEFLEFDGDFTFDEANPEAGSVNVTIDTNSLSMDDDVWTDHTKTKFFDTENHPNMTFKSTEVLKTGEDTALLTGDLTMLGVTKPVTLDVKLNKVEMDDEGGATAGFSATGNIKRSEWGMDYGQGMIGDDVELRIEVEANAKDGMNK